MNKKVILVVLILLVLFSGCAEKKEQELKDYKIEINSGLLDFETESIGLEVETETMLSRARFEVFDETKELKCFDYFDLKKGKNKISVKCPETYAEKLFLEITPSDGITKKMPIEIKFDLKEDIVLKKGFKYYFQTKYTVSPSTDHNIFILDENKDFTKGIVYGKPANTPEYYILFLLDKNLNQIFISNIEKKCSKAYNSVITSNIPQGNVFKLLFPFFLSYLGNDENYSFDDLIKNKYTFARYTDENGEFMLAEFHLIKETIWQGREAYQIEYWFEGLRSLTLFVQAKKPNIILYGYSEKKTNDYSLTFKREIKEEFNEEKQDCFSD